MQSNLRRKRVGWAALTAQRLGREIRYWWGRVRGPICSLEAREAAVAEVSGRFSPLEHLFVREGFLCRATRRQ